MTDTYTLANCIESGIIGAAYTSSLLFYLHGIKQEDLKRKKQQLEAKELSDLFKNSRIDPMAEESVQAFDNSLYFHAHRFDATAIRIVRPFRNSYGQYEIAVVGKDKKFPNSPKETQTFARFTKVSSPLGGFEIEQTYFTPFSRFNAKVDAKDEEKAILSTYDVALKYAQMASRGTMLPLQNGCGNAYKKMLRA